MRPTLEDERRIRAQALVREWTRSGLLDPSQGAALGEQLRVDVRRTNLFLRVGLALFTALIISASVMLIVVVLHLDDAIPSAIVTGMSAIACLALAQHLVARRRFYRFGVEEALAVGSVALMAISAAALTYGQHRSHSGNGPLVAALVLGAGGGVGIYLRFGFVYAVIGAIACAVAIPFQLELPDTTRRALAAAALAVAFVAARAKWRQSPDEYPGDDYALVQAAAWAGLYLTLNIQLTGSRTEGPFYWFTYAMIWALPLAGLYLGTRHKVRPLLDASLVMTLVTLLTNKAYLGWPRHEWDPIVLGVILMAGAIAVRRWLSNGPNGQRAGFTPARILTSDTGAVTMLGTASAKFHPDAASFPEPDAGGFDGGRSGGGGASGTY